MANVFVHEVKLSSDELHDGGASAGTVLSEGRTWSIATIDPLVGYELAADMNGFVVSVDVDATAPVLAKLESAAMTVPNGETGAVPVLQGAERYIRTQPGQSLFVQEAG